jgi:hypothetical protein
MNQSQQVTEIVQALDFPRRSVGEPLLHGRAEWFAYFPFNGAGNCLFTASNESKQVSLAGPAPTWQINFMFWNSDQQSGFSSE